MFKLKNFLYANTALNFLTYGFTYPQVCII